MSRTDGPEVDASYPSRALISHSFRRAAWRPGGGPRACTATVRSVLAGYIQVELAACRRLFGRAARHVRSAIRHFDLLPPGWAVLALHTYEACGKSHDLGKVEGVETNALMRVNATGTEQAVAFGLT